MFWKLNSLVWRSVWRSWMARWGPIGCRSAAGEAFFQKRILRGKPWVFVKPQMAYTIYHIYIYLHKYIYIYIFWIWNWCDSFGFEDKQAFLGAITYQQRDFLKTSSLRSNGLKTSPLSMSISRQTHVTFLVISHAIYFMAFIVSFILQPHWKANTDRPVMQWYTHMKNCIYIYTYIYSVDILYVCIYIYK